MNEPVLVTGAGGFIGMHVCVSLLRSGVDVVGIDSLGPGHLPVLEQLRHDRLQEIERQIAVPGDRPAGRAAAPESQRAWGDVCTTSTRQCVYGPGLSKRSMDRRRGASHTGVRSLRA